MEEVEKIQQAEDYGAGSITVLEGLESLRKQISENQIKIVKLETELEDSQNKKRRATTSSTI